jgi:hypothetical protein
VFVQMESAHAAVPAVSNLRRRDVASHGSPIKDIERDLILETLAKTDGNRTCVYRKLKLGGW